VQPDAGFCNPFVAPRVALFSVREIAAHLGVSTATVYKLVASGVLPHVRVSSAIRVVEADLAAFVAGRGGRL
jgi:excisionase family DNA binding protein